MTVPKRNWYAWYNRTTLEPSSSSGTIPDSCTCPDTLPIGDLEYVCRCYGTIFKAVTYDVRKHHQETHA